MRQPRLSVLAVLAAISLTGPALADPAGPLRAALVATPMLPEALGPTFADLEAAAMVLAAQDTAALASRNPLLTTQLGPLILARPLGGEMELRVSSESDWPDRVGFAVGDIRTVTGFGQPPGAGMRLTLTPEVMATVGATLGANGYETVDTAAGPVLRRGEQDFGVSMADRDPSDPFGGTLGQASRVAIRDAVLIRSAGMPAVQSALTGPYWGSRPDLMAVVDAFSDLPDDVLILRAQVLIDHGAFAGSGLAAVMPGLLDGKDPAPAPATAPGIPPWSVGLMADVVTGDTPGVTFAFAYATRDQAEAGAAGVIAGWEAPLPSLQQAPAQVIGPVTTTVAGTGPFILMVTATGAWSTEGLLQNLAFERAWRAVMMRDLTVFGPAPF